MAILAAIYHLTHYRYDRPVVLGRRSSGCSRRRIRAPRAQPFAEGRAGQPFVNLQQDPYGNWLARFVFPEPVSELKIEVDLVADMTVYNPFDFFVEPSAENWPFDYPEDIRDDLAIYRTPEPVGAAARRRSSPASTARDRTPSISSSTSTRGCSARSATSSAWRPACRRPRRRSPPATGSCRDIELAAGAGPAQPRPRRALRLGLPDPAEARPRRARRPARHRRTTSPTCTPGARSICPAPAGSASTRLPAC